MKSKNLVISTLFLFAILFSFQVSAREFYQIKVYTIKDKAQENTMDKYLKNAYLPALHKAGISTVGVFKPIETDAAAGTKIFVFIPLKDLNQINVLDEKLLKDQQYQNAASEYMNAQYDNPPFQRIQSILIKAFPEKPHFSVPNHKTPASDQIYELRSYQGPTEKLWRQKVKMFNQGGEIGIFTELNFNAVFYGGVISGADMPNLMYMTSFSDMESNKAHWDAFRTHPDWEKLKNEPEYANTVSHIDKWLCHPAEYSDIK